MRYYFTIPNLFFYVKILVPFLRPALLSILLLQSNENETFAYLSYFSCLTWTFVNLMTQVQEKGPSALNLTCLWVAKGVCSVHYYSCLYYCAFLRVSNVVIILLLPPNVMKETFSLALLGGVIHTTQTLLSRRKKQRSLSLICMHS